MSVISLNNWKRSKF